MPARLEEAFTTSYDYTNKNILNQKGGGNPIGFWENPSQNPGGNPSGFFQNPSEFPPSGDLESLFTSSSSLNSIKNPVFQNNISQTGGAPQRPSLTHPYMSDVQNSCRTGPVSRETGLEDIAYKCSPVGKGYVPDTPVAYNACGSVIEHIWSCSVCRSKLRDLIEPSRPQSPPKTTEQLNLNKLVDNLPNLVHALLVILGIVILIDYFMRLGQKIGKRLF